MPVQVNPYRFSAGASLVDAFVAATEDSSNATVYTFTNHAIGVADASRVVAVGIVVDDSGTDNQISSVTIGGSAATMATDTTSAGVVGRGRIAAIYYLVVAAGTTATIVVTMANGADSCGIAVWSLYPSSSTPVDAVSNDVASSGSVTASNIAVTAGGTMVMVGYGLNANAASFSWNGTETVTNNIDEQLGDSGFRWNAATMTVTTSTSDRDLTYDPTGTPNCCVAAASWGP